MPFPAFRIGVCPRLTTGSPAVLLLALALTGCAMPRLSPPPMVKPSNANGDAALTPATRITRDLVRLPPPRFRVPIAVYSFRDQTGQFKQQPDSNLSAAVTQGAASLLVKALLDSGWYLPIEREGFQNLLNERRVARAIEVPSDRGKAGSSYPQLIAAQFLLEGGIVGYETNTRTGGNGANLLGVGAETKYRVDQVTVNLRSVDIRTGQVVNSVSVTKTIYSHQLSSSVYKFVSYKTLLQTEGGYSTNEPAQLAVKSAIESAVIHLTVQGIGQRVWALKNEDDWWSPLLQAYAGDGEMNLAEPDAARPERVALRDSPLIIPPAPPLHLATIGPANPYIGAPAANGGAPAARPEPAAAGENGEGRARGEAKPALVSPLPPPDAPRAKAPPEAVRPTTPEAARPSTPPPPGAGEKPWALDRPPPAATAADPVRAGAPPNPRPRRAGRLDDPFAHIEPADPEAPNGAAPARSPTPTRDTAAVAERLPQLAPPAEILADPTDPPDPPNPPPLPPRGDR